MTDSINTVSTLYNLNAGVLEKCLDGLTAEQFATRPNETTNSIHWILGHIACSRYFVGGMLGLENNFKHNKYFDYGAELKDPSVYPSPEELADSFKDIHGKMIECLKNPPLDKLKEKPEVDFPGVEQTVLGAVTFMAFHETYHVGQISLVKRFLGHDRLFG